MVYCISCNPKTRHLSILKEACKTSPQPLLLWTLTTFAELFSTRSRPCMEILCIHYRLVFGVQYLKNKLWDHCLKRQFFFFFSRCYNPWLVLACFTISFHNLLSLHFSLQFLAFIFFKSSSTWSSHLSLGLPTGLDDHGCH